MSLEEPSTGKSDAYSGFLANFGSEVGSTLEDLATDWNKDEYEENKHDIENIPENSIPIQKSRPKFKSRVSMDSLEGMTDLSLRKARPLAFANPVYDLVNSGGVIARSRQMTLIPISQFDINKPDHGKKHKSGKRGSHGLMNKISNTIRKHHSMKKQEQEINVTAPLWTDVPATSYDEPMKRSSSLKQNSAKIDSEKENKETPLASLELEQVDEKETVKLPPQKGPRKFRGNFSSLDDEPLIIPQDNALSPGSTSSNTGSLELPSEKRLKNADSSSSIASDISEDQTEEEQTSKTMMEVMNEISDESSNEEDVTQQKYDGTEIEETLLLKRNKTVKWSGSRSAPALIREFTKKSKRNQKDQDIPEDSAVTGNPPFKASNDVGLATDDPESTKKTQIEKLQGNGTKTGPPIRTAPRVRDNNAFTVLSSLLPPAPKLRRTESTKIRMYINRMGTNTQNPLGYATTEFVRQTITSKELRPIVLLHNIRSFQTDIKKYMISNPHLSFMVKIHKIVKNTAITDIEGAIDDALERLILYPLRDFIYKRLVRDYAKSGKISIVEDAIKIGETKSLRELGIRSTLIPPGEEALETIRHCFDELQTTFSPYYKLKHLLSAVTTIYENTTDLACEDHSARKIGADDFLPLLVYSVIKCNFTAADIEAQYIDGLLDPTLLLGEGGYYLTTLISAVQVLSSMKTPLPNIADLQGFLKVGISSKTVSSGEFEEADDDKGCLLLHKTLHVPPSMTSHNLGLMIAKKYNIKDTKNYCLHVVVNGVAYPLKSQEFPQLVKMDLLTQFQSNSFFFLYRQIAKTPEKHTKRPVTMDTEHLKVNTELGEDIEFVAEEIEEVTKDSSEDSESGKDEDILDNLPPPIDDGISSPGFADIPLPDFLIFNMEVASSQVDATPALSNATVTHPGATPDFPVTDAHAKDDDNTTDDDAMPPPPVSDVGTTSTYPDTTLLLPDPDFKEVDFDFPLPPADPVLLETEEQMFQLDTTITPFDTTLTPFDLITDDFPVPDPMSFPESVHSKDPTVLLSTDESPHTLTTQPLGVVIPQLEITHPPDNFDLCNIPPPDLDDLSSSAVDDYSHSITLDTSDADLTSEEDNLFDETYHSAALVDENLSPAKKSKKNVQKKSVASFPSSALQEVILEEDSSDSNLHSSSTETEFEEINEESKEESGDETTTIIENPTTSPAVPSFVITGLSPATEHDSETFSETIMSDVSRVCDARHSTGCHSDANYKQNDSSQSSRGYHSDGHQADETDIGALTSVSSLKSYFESEITKVTQDFAKAVSSHSPK